jgi:pimeloyl-ACP methyl ester carboxylesterase
MKKPSNGWRRLLKALLVLIFIVMLFRWFEHSQVYHPSRTMDATGAELGRPFENVFFKTGDGIELNAWFFPANTNSPRAHLAVLVCHGNGGNISHRLALYRALLETGVAVFAFDYRGYGRSQGRPGEEGTYLDAQAAYQWLTKEGFADIIVFGESLGGGIASELCLREKMRGLILLSAFTSIPDIGKEFFPWLPAKLLGTIEYDTRARLPRLKIPVLVMHSRADELAAFHHAERNFAAANEPKLFWEITGGHNDALDEPARFVEGIEKFLGLVERQPASVETK